MGKKKPQPPARGSQEHQSLQRIFGLLPDSSLSPNLKDPVFVCIDCEAFESDQEKVTELGVAILDTKRKDGSPQPSTGGEWIERMQYAHYRPAQYAEHLNRKFVKGRERHFNFGHTFWINLSDASEILRRIFADPTEIGKAAQFADHIIDRKRNIVFVSHGIGNETKYLQSLGYNLSESGNVVLNMDTQVLVGGSKKVSTALRRLLLSLKIDHANLHNAANDAAYTLQAMVLMVFKEHRCPGSVATGLQAWAGKLPPSPRVGGEARHCPADTVKSAPDTSPQLQAHGQPVTVTQIASWRRQHKQKKRAERQTIVPDPQAATAHSNPKSSSAPPTT